MKSRTREDLSLARARTLAPLIEGASADIERLRAIRHDILDALHEQRMFRLLLPRSVDGEEISPPAFFRVIEQLAQADASTAWCVAQNAGCSVAAAYLRPEVAREIFGDAKAVLAWGPFGPNSKAVVVDGGYRVSGEWMFASGSRHSGWLGAHCTVVEADGTPRVDADGRPLERTMLFPKAKAEIKDVWHVVGLKGTGSDNYAVRDLFVPEEYSFTRESAQERRETGALYRFTIYHLYGIGFAAIALGIARSCLDTFIDLAKNKIPRGQAKTLRDNAVVQAKVALSEAKWQSSRAFLAQVLDELWVTASGGDSLTIDQRTKLRLAATYAIHQSKDAVDTVYHTAGTTAIFESNPFERRFRDIHTVIQQVQAQSPNFELVGQLLLGLKPSSRLI